MNCKQAEIAIMQQMEKTITPADARKLAKHILICETCRESYLVFDEAMEYATADAEAFPLTEAPTGFTEAVMTQVRGISLTPTVSEPENGQMVLRILWGLSAIFLGAGLFLIYNSEWMSTAADTYPAIYSIVTALNNIGQFLIQGAEWIMQSIAAANAAGTSTLSITALLFTLTIGTLLFILYRQDSEKSIEM